jgi:hypothetical protein
LTYLWWIFCSLTCSRIATGASSRIALTESS